MNGYDAEIHEAHTFPGGLCTAWKRGEYLFDGCIHWLVGSGPGSELYDIWNELGVIKGRKYFDHEVFSGVKEKGGKRLDFFTDVDRLEAHMKELSPGDAEPIGKLCGIIRRFTRFEMPMKKAGELMGFLDGVRIMLRIGPFIKDFRAIGGLSLAGLGSWFEDPFLKSAITYSLFDGSMPAFALIMTLAGMNGKKAGFPIGGSLEFAKTIERRFTDLGGKIVYGSRARYRGPL
jgi:phytoene dehydrogenase-like protein